MTDKELIKKEIKNLKAKADDESSYSNGWKQALRAIEIFINFIPEEPANEDLEKVAKSYGFLCYKRACFHPEHKWPSTTEDAFKAGANWREQQMKEALQTEYEKGRFDMREEMMKMAEDTAGLSLSWEKDSKTKIIIIEEEQ